MRRTRLVGDTVQVGRFFSLDLIRTLRIPDDGQTYPLPPGLGSFPIRRVSDYARKVPAAWRESGGFFFPMYQREALWLAFYDSARWHPVAVKIGIGGVDAITGRKFSERLHRRPQDYVVAPEQPWLDGIKSGKGTIRQFVAARLGEGLTVEAQITGAEETGGIQLTVVEPRKGIFPERDPRRTGRFRGLCMMVSESLASPMGLGAGGMMKQSIYPDRHGLDTWDPSTATTFHVHIADSRTWKSITAEEPPATPISAKAYTDFGFPWFDLYDEHRGDLAASKPLAGVKSIGQLEGGESRIASDPSLAIPPKQVVSLMS